MQDWGAPLIAAVLFALLSPGLLFQMPARNRPFEFMNMATNASSILFHAFLYILLLTLCLIVFHLHLYV